MHFVHGQRLAIWSWIAGHPFHQDVISVRKKVTIHTDDMLAKSVLLVGNGTFVRLAIQYLGTVQVLLDKVVPARSHVGNSLGNRQL